MNATNCWRESVSCSACCGIFNLNLPDFEARSELLRERSERFSSVDFNKVEMLREYRNEREHLEESIPRRDPEIYVCPFLGYPDAKSKRTGCLIHPIYTGRSNSQDASFYGASICQAYDCRVKDRDTEQIYASFLEKNFPAKDEYARLTADGLFHSALERLPDFPFFLENPEKAGALLRLLRARLATPRSRAVSSFEIKFRYFDSVREELLEYTRESTQSRTEREAAIDCLLNG